MYEYLRAVHARRKGSCCDSVFGVMQIQPIQSCTEMQYRMVNFRKSSASHRVTLVCTNDKWWVAMHSFVSVLGIVAALSVNPRCQKRINKAVSEAVQGAFKCLIQLRYLQALRTVSNSVTRCNEVKLLVRDLICSGVGGRSWSENQAKA